MMRRDYSDTGGRKALPDRPVPARPRASAAICTLLYPTCRLHTEISIRVASPGVLEIVRNLIVLRVINTDYYRLQATVDSRKYNIIQRVSTKYILVRFPLQKIQNRLRKYPQKLENSIYWGIYLYFVTRISWLYFVMCFVSTKDTVAFKRAPRVSRV